MKNTATDGSDFVYGKSDKLVLRPTAALIATSAVPRVWLFLEAVKQLKFAHSGRWSKLLGGQDWDHGPATYRQGLLVSGFVTTPHPIWCAMKMLFRRKSYVMGCGARQAI